jgi:hypothetical protein
MKVRKADMEAMNRVMDIRQAFLEFIKAALVTSIALIMLHLMTILFILVQRSQGWSDEARVDLLIVLFIYTFFTLLLGGGLAIGEFRNEIPLIAPAYTQIIGLSWLLHSLLGFSLVWLWPSEHSAEVLVSIWESSAEIQFIVLASSFLLGIALLALRQNELTPSAAL